MPIYSSCHPWIRWLIWICSGAVLQDVHLNIQGLKEKASSVQCMKLLSKMIKCRSRVNEFREFFPSILLIRGMWLWSVSSNKRSMSVKACFVKYPPFYLIVKVPPPIGVLLAVIRNHGTRAAGTPNVPEKDNGKGSVPRRAGVSGRTSVAPAASISSIQVHTVTIAAWITL